MVGVRDDYLLHCFDLSSGKPVKVSSDNFCMLSVLSVSSPIDTS